MKIIRIIVLVTTIPIFVFAISQKEKSEYISLDYAYDFREKPVPAIVFYTDTFNVKRLSPIRYEFKITKKQFQSLENLIKNESSYIIIDSFAVRYYDISIFKNQKNTIYGTVNLSRSKQLFTKLIDSFNGTGNYSGILEAFEFVYTQVGPRK